MVSQQLLDELHEIIEEEYGQDLEMEKISQIGNGLVGYFDLLAKMHHENNQNNQNNENEYEYEISTTKIHR